MSQSWSSYVTRDDCRVDRTDGDGFVDELGQLIEVEPVGRHALLREVVEDECHIVCHLLCPVELHYARQRAQVVVWVVVSDQRQPAPTSA